MVTFTPSSRVFDLSSIEPRICEGEELLFQDSDGKIIMNNNNNNNPSGSIAGVRHHQRTSSPMNGDYYLPSYDFSSHSSSSVPSSDDSVSSHSTVGSFTSAASYAGPASAAAGSSSAAASAAPRRSMFQKYWKQTGQEPQNMRRSASEGRLGGSHSLHGESLQQQQAAKSEGKTIHPNLIRRASTSSADEPTCAVVTAAVEDAFAPAAYVPPPATTAPSPRRRSILPQPPPTAMLRRQSQSLPSFSEECDEENGSGNGTSMYRKSASSSDIQRCSSHRSLAPMGSCLRETRFSGAKKRRDSNGSTSSAPAVTATATGPSPVRFDMEAIAVVHYEPPMERYAEQGWSNFFQ